MNDIVLTLIILFGADFVTSTEPKQPRWLVGIVLLIIGVIYLVLKGTKVLQ